MSRSARDYECGCEREGDSKREKESESSNQLRRGAIYESERGGERSATSERDS